MNIVKRWLERRRNRRESDRIAKEQHEQEMHKSRTACLKGFCEEITQELIRIGFNPMKMRTVNDSATVATFVAIGPDHRAYRVEVYNRGGYDIEPLNK